MKTAVVTGGGTGIGKAVAERLSGSGIRVIIVSRREEVLAAAAAAINKAHGDDLVEFRTADLTDPGQVAELARGISAETGVDYLINNVGGGQGRGGPLLVDIADSFYAEFTGNVMTSVLITEALLPVITRPGGRIVLISSVAGLRGAGAYGVAKAALNSYMWDLATRLAPEHVTANVIAPGFVPDTEYWHSRRDEVPALVAKIPMKRAGTPSELAEAVAYLCHEKSGWTTGQILQVNGGALLGHG